MAEATSASTCEDHPMTALKYNLSWLLVVSLVMALLRGEFRSAFVLLTLIILIYTVMMARARLAARKELQAPCIHGIPRARHNADICPHCAADAVKQRIARARIAEEEAQRIEVHRLEKANELAQRQALALQRLSTLDGLRSLEPDQFQYFIWHLFDRIGFVIDKTPMSADGGVDGFATRNGHRFALQIKRYKGAIGSPQLRDFFGAMQHAKVLGGIIITTSNFTVPAVAFADKKPIILVTGEMLIDLIESAPLGPGSLPLVLTRSLSGDPTPLCPQCDAPMRVVSWKRRKFWGCSNYPRCKHTKSDVALSSSRYRTTRGRP
jgi:restriction system protein